MYTLFPNHRAFTAALKCTTRTDGLRRCFRNRSSILGSHSGNEMPFTTTISRGKVRCVGRSVVKYKYATRMLSHCEKSCGDEVVNMPGDKFGKEPFVSSMRDVIQNELMPMAIGSVNGSAVDKAHKFVAVLGVSGGCDSMALLHGLMSILNDQNGCLVCESKLYKCEVHVVHFDHRQRGEDSDRDKMFVRNVWKTINQGVPKIHFQCFTWGNADDLGATTSYAHFSQESARKWRRSLLQKVLFGECGDRYPGIVLTGHHADDNDETLLLKAIRGAHLTSLSGMGSYSQFPSNNTKGPEFTLFGRPLINVRKRELQRSLSSHLLSWREDASNTSDKYLRNRVRNELIPLLSELAGGDSALQVNKFFVITQDHFYSLLTLIYLEAAPASRSSSWEIESILRHKHAQRRGNRGRLFCCSRSQHH